MAWGRFGDTAHSHRKLLRAAAKRPDDVLRSATVWGVVTLCVSWSSQEGMDWWVGESFVRSQWGDAGLTVMREGQACGLVKPGRHKRDGENGWLIDDSDPDLIHMRTVAEILADRDAAKTTRQTEPRRDVRLRDGDQCRYCGKTVNWKDRTSGRRGTYDHPDPADRETFVVCCGLCNNSKYNRTVEEWIATGTGRPLLPAPDKPFIGLDTAEQFGVVPTDPAALRAHTGTQPADAATPRPGSQPDPAPAQSAATGAPSDLLDLDLASPRVADLPASGRDGPGRVGSPPSPTTDTPSRARPRGSRGNRRRRSSS